MGVLKTGRQCLGCRLLASLKREKPTIETAKLVACFYVGYLSISIVAMISPSLTVNWPRLIPYPWTVVSLLSAVAASAFSRYTWHNHLFCNNFVGRYLKENRRRVPGRLRFQHFSHGWFYVCEMGQATKHPKLMDGVSPSKAPKYFGDVNSRSG